MKKTSFLIAALLLVTLHFAFSSSALAQQIRTFRNAPQFDAGSYKYYNPEVNWVDSVLHSLSLRQRIAQLMVVRVPIDMNPSQADQFIRTVNNLGVGGVCFFSGTADRQVQLTRDLQASAPLPLLVCLDAEWGLGMRLKDMFSFPRNNRFGLLPPDQDSIVWRMGQEIGRQCREMGVHVNFAPVVDINSNPRNPVIGVRSFGIDRERVSQLGIMYALGQQSQGVLATAKHFPGHGDTETDSHFELPVINHSRAYIDTIDTYPFRRLIETGVGGVMVAHLQVNALDPDRPSSLSPAVVNGLLRSQMGFDGIIVTDGLDMKGVTNTYRDGNAELAALLAGNDILLLPPDVTKAIETIHHEASLNDSIRTLVDHHCRRVLHAKYRYVMPYIDDDIHVPEEKDYLGICTDIVSELNLNIDPAIDSIVQSAIEAHATPGCQIAVLHKGRLVLNRAYGHLSYDTGATPVTTETLYDLASLTKVCATTLAIMKLVDQGKLSINDPLSRYLPYLKGTDKEPITVIQTLSHCAGLKAYDAFWQQSSNRDTILSLIAHSKLNADKSYCYSDLGFILLADLVEHLSGQPLDKYLRDNFYSPMHLTHTSFTPLASHFPIAPTEIDSLRGPICGTVHDPNAFALGGVAGHAGLFSNASDIACLMQMLLNGGTLDGRRYLKQQTVETFTSRHFAKQGNRRALGFDKQLFNPSPNAQTCPESSQSSFGHTGFTGTMLWVDPDYQLVFVFLSNRVHPSAAQNKLAKMNTRTQIQSAIYKTLTR